MAEEFKKLLDEAFNKFDLGNFEPERKDGNVHIRTKGLYLVMDEKAYDEMTAKVVKEILDTSENLATGEMKSAIELPNPFTGNNGGPSKMFYFDEASPPNVKNDARQVLDLLRNNKEEKP